MPSVVSRCRALLVFARLDPLRLPLSLPAMIGAVLSEVSCSVADHSFTNAAASSCLILYCQPQRTRFPPIFRFVSSGQTRLPLFKVDKCPRERGDNFAGRHSVRAMVVLEGQTSNCGGEACFMKP